MSSAKAGNPGLQGQVCTVHSQLVRTGVKGGYNESLHDHFNFDWKNDFKYDLVPADRKLVQAFIKKDRLDSQKATRVSSSRAQMWGGGGLYIA